MFKIFTTISKVYKENRYFGILILAVLMTGYLFLEIKNDRLTAPDFKVYYTGANNLLAGENLYRHADAGHYVFKYSPVCAMYFIPFSLFPFTMAKVLYWLFLVTLICSGLILSYHLINPDFGKSGDQKRFNNLVLLTALITGVHVARELELGQMNQLLYVLYITMIVFYQKKKDVFLSLFWAISIFIKPFGLIFLPWLILKKKYRVIKRVETDLCSSKNLLPLC